MKAILMLGLCIFSGSAMAYPSDDEQNRVDLDSGGNITINGTLVTCKSAPSAAKKLPNCVIVFEKPGENRNTPFGRATLSIEGEESSTQVFEGKLWKGGWITVTKLDELNVEYVRNNAVTACRGLQQRGNCTCNY